MLLILLAAVDTESVSKSKEFMFYNMPQKTADAVLEKSMGNGKADFIENTVFELKPAAFELTDIQTGDAVKYNFDDKKTVSLRTRITSYNVCYTKLLRDSNANLATFSVSVDDLCLGLAGRCRCRYCQVPRHRSETRRRLRR